MVSILLILLSISLQTSVAHGVQCKQILSKESAELQGLDALDKLEEALRVFSAGHVAGGSTP